MTDYISVLLHPRSQPPREECQGGKKSAKIAVLPFFVYTLHPLTPILKQVMPQRDAKKRVCGRANQNRINRQKASWGMEHDVRPRGDREAC
ncbi:hypothetical protein NPIL_204421 [Nephila pilipes]|uniref:Uncharacterized protein n=1 Tax=Nephila pilipes TaxID=299642 RepID=A0A8X6PAY9_NEPPI|nr:hypothetical protein NPIL_204421 [Nephila pilipes]